MTAQSFDVSMLSPVEQDAFSLTESALLLDSARQQEKRGHAVAEALNHNLDMWVAIRTLAQSEDSALTTDIRNNLVRLSSYVAETTFRHGAAIDDENLDTLININLQLSEGLLEGQARMRVAAE